MQGRIRQRSKGSYEIALDIGRDAQGRRRRKYETIRGKKSDAQRRLRELIATNEKGLPLNSGKVTVAEFLETWYRDYVVPNTRPRTQMSYGTIIRVHLTPRLGHIRLEKLQPQDVQTMEAALIVSGKSPRTVIHIHRVLAEALKYALRWGVVWRNVTEAVDPPRAEHRDIQVPEVEAVLEALEAAKQTPHGTAIHVLAYTACRRGEALGLRWQDCDLEKGSASIVQTVQWIKGQGPIMQPTKSASSRRTIALGPVTVAALEAHRTSQAPHRLRLGIIYHNHGLVFPGPLGEPLDPSALTHAWERIARKCSISGVRLHDLRHFHATCLLQLNINPKIVQERLGHATYAMTMDIYSHVVPGLQEQASLAFEESMELARKAAAKSRAA